MGQTKSGDHRTGIGGLRQPCLLPESDDSSFAGLTIREVNRRPSTEPPGESAGAAKNAYRVDMSYAQRLPVWPLHQSLKAFFVLQDSNDAMKLSIRQPP